MNQKYLKYINTLFVVLPMTLIMSIVGVTRNAGFSDYWILKVLSTWLIMFPVAYLAAFFIIPVANKLTHKVASQLKYFKQ